MINDKPDVLLHITKKICEACSPSREEIREKGYFDPKENSRYLSQYTTVEEFYPESVKKVEEDGTVTCKKIGKPKKYAYSLYLSNKRIENAWGRAVAEKTKKYLRSLYY
jgi:hypothetical protein